MDQYEDYSNLESGRYALHLAVSNQHDDRAAIVRFILENDKSAASRVGAWGRLPLHEACASNLNLAIIKAIFEAYPQAIHTQDLFGRLPIHFVFGCHELRKGDFHSTTLVLSSKRQTGLVIDYLVEQLPYSLKARDNEGRTVAHFAAVSTLAMKTFTVGIFLPGFE